MRCCRRWNMRCSLIRWISHLETRRIRLHDRKSKEWETGGSGAAQLWQKINKYIKKKKITILVCRLTLFNLIYISIKSSTSLIISHLQLSFIKMGWGIQQNRPWCLFILWSLIFKSRAQFRPSLRKCSSKLFNNQNLDKIYPIQVVAVYSSTHTAQHSRNAFVKMLNQV